MNLQFYLEKLQESKNFKNFKKENPDAFLCSGFFVIDKEGNDNKQHFDFWIPKSKKMISFQFEEGIKKVEVEVLDARVPEEIPLNCNFDFEYIEKLIVGEMFEKNIDKKIQKILFSLQRLNGKDSLIGTVFVSGLGILKININLSDGKITDFEKKSFLDMLKVFKKKGD